MTRRQRALGANRAKDPFASDAKLMRQSGYAASTSRLPAEKLPPGGSEGLAARVIEEDPTARVIESEIRGQIASRVRSGRASDGLLAAGWKVSAEILSGEAAPPPGATEEDFDRLQQVVNAAALEVCRRVWERERPGLPVPALTEADFQAIAIRELYEQLVLDDAPDVPVDGKVQADDAIDAERGGRQVHLPTVRTTCRGCETTRLVDEPEEQS
jgi:hypothetical protein